MVTTSGPTAAATRTILHVDMDAFYASVELLRRPELRGRPVVVGGPGARGVVAAASYEARAYGVHSAMPSVRARRLCPDAVFLAGDGAHYAEVSARLMEVFRSVTPLVEPLSLDEAFLDISGTERLLGAPHEVAGWLRRRVREEEDLACSIGVAPNKFLAKLATNRAKPRAGRDGPVEGTGVHVVAPGRELAFLRPLPVGALWGVGPATLDKLERLGVTTVGQLADTPVPALASLLGRGVAAHLHALANGRDDRPVVPDQEPRSISNEETFAVDLTSLEQLRGELVRLSDSVAARLRHHGYRGRTVQLKVRYRDFTTVTRSCTLPAATDRGTDLVHTAWEMLERLPVDQGVRLLGVGVSNLGREPVAHQLRLDDAGSADWDAANEAVDAIRDRFGAQLIRPARLAGRPERSQSAQWGPDGSGGRPPPSAENPPADRSGRDRSG
jgi:DNA polymerase-4